MMSDNTEMALDCQGYFVNYHHKHGQLIAYMLEKSKIYLW